MAAGGGATYPEVIRLLKEKVAQKGQRTVSRETGIALLSIQRYLKGIGEPTTATLQKLADYFEVSVADLRGESLLDDEVSAAFGKIFNGVEIIKAYSQGNQEIRNTAIEIDEAARSILQAYGEVRHKEQTLRDRTHAIFNVIPIEEFPNILEKLKKRYPDGEVPRISDDPDDTWLADDEIGRAKYSKTGTGYMVTRKPPKKNT